MSILWLLLQRDAAAPDREPGAAVPADEPDRFEENDPGGTHTQRLGASFPLSAHVMASRGSLGDRNS